MRRFRIQPFRAAILSALVTLATDAGAVNLGNDGTGQALIYPYYTVRTAGPGDWATYLNVVNHTADTKTLRLRFREGKNGRSVFDMNLYLGSGDVWAGAVSRTAEGAQLLSSDKSCVTASGGFAASAAAGKLSAAFSNASYVGVSTTQGISDGYDGEDTSLDRTREGFFEIIEMGVVTSTAIINGLKHDDAGVPANCGVIASIDSGVIAAPRGGLSGGASLIHVMKGSDFGYEPVVLEDFYRPVNPGDDLWTAPGNVLPDLSQATPVSRVFYLHKSETAGMPHGMVTDLLETTWSRGVDAVSAVLMHSRVKNTYVLDAATLSLTDWVVTFPTKHHYVSANRPGTSATNDPNGTQRLAPFHNFFWNGACDPIHSVTWDREERTFTSSIYSIPQPTPPTDLCNAANILTLKNTYAPIPDASTLLGSKKRFEPAIPSDFQNGLMELVFLNPLPMVGSSVATTTAESYNGLPAIGFMAQDFLNTNVSIGGLPAASSYGGNFTHKYRRSITGGSVTP